VRSSGSTMQLLFKVILIAVKVGTCIVPVVAFSTFVLFKGTLYFTEEICLQIVSAEISILFCVMDTMLSAGYLLLFILPVLSHLKTMEAQQKKGAGPADKGASGSDIKDTATRNLKISVVAMVSTFMYTVGVGAISAFLGTDEDAAMVSSLHLLSYQYYMGPIDCIGRYHLNYGRCVVVIVVLVSKLVSCHQVALLHCATDGMSTINRNAEGQRERSKTTYGMLLWLLERDVCTHSQYSYVNKTN
jgi:hypothetical protein